MWRIGIDVGGTFTDLAAVDETGRVVIAKCASTPRDQSEGLMEGLGLLAVECGTDLVGLLKSTERIVHGTTVATNALLERKGAKVGLLTTEGHRDVIEMREGLKDDRYNVGRPPPVRLVPRARRLGMRERVAADGRVTVPLAARSLATALETLARARVVSVAVCYLHAYRNPRHERLTARALARRLRGVYVSLSSVVLPQIKEYERIWTTVVNAHVDPGGILHVGPESAGADPGPACYGKGGDRATVTDANVVLGFLDPANFLGGRIALDRRAAELAVDRVARALGTERLAAAEGIAKVVDTNMAEGIKIVSVRRGVDPRKFTLVAFGGAAGLHVTEVARLLEIRCVVIPNVAAVLSAWGMLATGPSDRVRRDAPKAARRRVWLGDWVEVPVFRLDELPVGWETKGPALFESATTTVLARAGERVSVTPHGWLDLRLS